MTIIVTIPARQSSIYDLAKNFDVILEFDENKTIALVLPAYFNVDPEYFCSEEEAIEAYNDCDYDGKTLINRDGSELEIWQGMIVTKTLHKYESSTDR